MQLWGGHFWSEGSHIGTVGDSVTSEIIKEYINNQGAKEEPESFAQLNSSISRNLRRRLCPNACIGVRRRLRMGGDQVIIH